MTFSRKILVGLAAGVATGLVLGELVAPLQVVADGFVRLLQMTVLPYVTISIIVSLGSLNMQQARLLGLRGGLVVLGLWAIAFAVTWLMPLTWPDTETASFFSTTLVERRPPFDFVALYIPANPFNALANNVVPAVVLFSVVVGVALIGVEPKATLLEVLRTAATMIARATRVVVGLTPYGLFAIAAVAAGTLTIEEMQRIQIYLVTYCAMSTIVALWILPGLIAALTGLRIRDLFGRLRDSLIVAFVAGDLFIVLPGLIEGCKELLATHSRDVLSGAGLERPRRRARRDRAGLVQLPACRQAALAQLRAVRRLVLRRGPAAPRLPAAVRRRAAVVLRQPEQRRAVSAGPVRPAGGHLPAVPGHGSDQLPVRDAGRRDAHGDRGDRRERRRHGRRPLALPAADPVRRRDGPHRRGQR